MAFPVKLPGGQHELFDPVVRWHPERSESDPKKVKLTATVQSGPSSPITPVSGTTLAIHMDADIAKDLHETLGQLGRSMGWLPPEG
jgi:hypothetical protein